MQDVTSKWALEPCLGETQNCHIKEQTILNSVDESFRYYIEFKKTESKEYIVSDFICIIYQGPVKLTHDVGSKNSLSFWQSFGAFFVGGSILPLEWSVGYMEIQMQEFIKLYTQDSHTLYIHFLKIW